MSKMRKMFLIIAAAAMMILCTAIPAMADSDCRHDFFNRVCSKCGYECEHPEDMSYDYDYEYAYGYEKAGYHYETIWCRQCKSEIPKLDTISKCDVTLGKHDVYQSYHTSSECPLCRHSYQEDCTYKKVYRKIDNPDQHQIVLVCTKCGEEAYQSSDESVQNHKFKNDKCTKCGFKRVVPAKAKLSKVTCSKVKITKVTHPAHWDDYGRWITAKTHNHYTYKVKLTFKKDKKTAKYYIGTKANCGTIQPNRLSDAYYGVKNNSTVKLEYCSKKTSVTLYAVSESKTGTIAKATKMKIKLKN